MSWNSWTADCDVWLYVCLDAANSTNLYARN